ncbi:MAG: hypothetical protein A2275_09390 [Bacteroidetes bacterium RIFOXYA12_FULL_35_11]|nr:MAG: hypothetical protein A2X01_04430 [Bacteroidetes bacterium GWF2_35_48]OFY73723.1 MAG: hypothetical protein A2275_09390 [Bacteroidetes bacterium RIFOXYA12_FULL_35_11]OFY93077.1 MAG: hypothetical protein A2491_01745 [Bacteroidetes bacterium RIFOXYC12_FULL_35_7]OFY96364.1 MAG: hypothetical protein A2309_02100 [Bacteroidetes bacterium RIFOXYB2_FULL_35_7]HBX53257.1 hypothetical protein [Bacteroidales bacterium]
MKPINIFILLLIFLTSKVFCQEQKLNVTLSTGLYKPISSNYPEKYTKDNLILFNGLNFYYPLSGKFILSSGFLYKKVNVEINYNVPTKLPNSLHFDSVKQQSIILYYIDVPINAHYFIVSKNKFSFGFSIGCLLNLAAGSSDMKEYSTNNNVQIIRDDWCPQSKQPTANIYATLGTIIKYQFSEHFGLYAEPQISYNSLSFYGESNNNGALQIKLQISVAFQ